MGTQPRQLVLDLILDAPGDEPGIHRAAVRGGQRVQRTPARQLGDLGQDVGRADWQAEVGPLPVEDGHRRLEVVLADVRDAALLEEERERTL